MSARILNLLPGVLLLIGIISARSVEAQSVCAGPPLLGTTGPELCVHIEETPSGASMDFRAPAGPTAPPLVIPPTTIGDYSVSMAVAYVFGPAGMLVTMDGVVTRTGPGTGGISVVANGGWGMPLGDATGDLTLFGFTTDTSLTQIGGAAGYPVGMVPAQDLAYTGFPRIIEEPTNGPGVFNTLLLDQPVAAGAVAVHMIATFHLNNVGESINIPSGVGLVPLDNPRTSPAEGPHFECYSVDKYSPQEDKYSAKEDKYTPQEKIPVTLKDQFANVEALLGDIKRLCTPVSKNKEEIPDPELHLVCYEILDGHHAERLAQVKNQFGKTEMKVRQAKELCVPSKKKLLKDEEPEQEKEPQKVEEPEKK